MRGDEIPDTVRKLAVAAEITGFPVRLLRKWQRAGKVSIYRLGHSQQRIYLVDLAELIDRLEKIEPTKHAEMRRRTIAHARAVNAQIRAERRMGGVQPGAMISTPPDRS